MQWGPLDENRIGQLGWEFTKLEAQVCAQAAPCSQCQIPTEEEGGIRSIAGNLPGPAWLPTAHKKMYAESITNNAFAVWCLEVSSQPSHTTKYTHIFLQLLTSASSHIFSQLLTSSHIFPSLLTSSRPARCDNAVGTSPSGWICMHTRTTPISWICMHTNLHNEFYWKGAEW